MNKEQATEFVIRELGKHHQRNDIIQKLCEAGGVSWATAEKFVQQVEAEHGSKIALRQSPLVTLVGVATALAGLALMAWVTMQTLQGYMILLLNFPVPYLGNVTYFLTGLAMLVAGIWGTWETIVKIWNG
jgi:hypothetical protein